MNVHSMFIRFSINLLRRRERKRSDRFNKNLPSRRLCNVQRSHRRWHSPWHRQPLQRPGPTAPAPCKDSRRGRAHHATRSCSPRGQTNWRSDPRRSVRSTAPPDVTDSRELLACPNWSSSTDYSRPRRPFRTNRPPNDDEFSVDEESFQFWMGARGWWGKFLYEILESWTILRILILGKCETRFKLRSDFQLNRI